MAIGLTPIAWSLFKLQTTMTLFFSKLYVINGLSSLTSTKLPASREESQHGYLQHQIIQASHPRSRELLQIYSQPTFVIESGWLRVAVKIRNEINLWLVGSNGETIVVSILKWKTVTGTLNLR